MSLRALLRFFLLFGSLGMIGVGSARMARQIKWERGLKLKVGLVCEVTCRLSLLFQLESNVINVAFMLLNFQMTNKCIKTYLKII